MLFIKKSGYIVHLFLDHGSPLRMSLRILLSFDLPEFSMKYSKSLVNLQFDPHRQVHSETTASFMFYYPASTEEKHFFMNAIELIS